MKELSIEQDISSILLRQRLAYFGHALRTNSDRFPYVLLHGDTYEQRPRRRPKKSYQDNIKEHCATFGFTIHGVATCWRQTENQAMTSLS